jgi:hypothetical protein
MMSKNFEAAGRSMGDLHQQQQVQIDPMKTCLLATWTKLFERQGARGKTAKFTRNKKFSAWIAYEWSGLLTDGSLVSECNPAYLYNPGIMPIVPWVVSCLTRKNTLWCRVVFA